MIENLAPYASYWQNSRGRRYQEDEDPLRSPFQRDRDRILHSSSFRRLKQKTQVFVSHEGDHYRTRLTHSLEVAQIARTIARVLRLDEDLAEAQALAHDLGHPPFGHAGEEALAEAMAEYGGFDHNEQTFRVLTRLEHRYARFDGLNLTWESLEGVVKHNGPLQGPQISIKQKSRPLPATIAQYDREVQSLELTQWPSLEAQVAAIADDIAYNNHDLDDGLRAGLFTPDDLLEVPLVGDVFKDISQRYPGLEPGRLIHEAVRRLIHLMVQDLLAESEYRLRQRAPASVTEVRAVPGPLIAFSGTMERNDRNLKQFLYRRMYRHYKVNRVMRKAREIIQDLFSLYLEHPDCLPRHWQEACQDHPVEVRARVIGDYIAGMTDRYAMEEHQKLFDLYSR